MSLDSSKKGQGAKKIDGTDVKYHDAGVSVATKDIKDKLTKAINNQQTQ